MSQIDRLIALQSAELLGKGYTDSGPLLRQLFKHLQHWDAQARETQGKNVSAKETTFNAHLSTQPKGGRLPVIWEFGYEYNPFQYKLSPTSVQASVFDVSVSLTNKEVSPFVLPPKKEFQQKLLQTLLITNQKHWHQYIQAHPLPNARSIRH